MWHPFRKTALPVQRVSADGLRRLPPEPTRRSIWPIAVITLLFLGAVFAAVYFYWQYRQSPSVQSDREIDSLVRTISAFVELPEGETPTLATVTDKSKLASQAFFQKAENGDKVLIYSESGRAILYRPSTKKIIDLTTINAKTPETNSQAVTGSALPTSTPRETPSLVVTSVALYNGSTKAGITNEIETQLTQTLKNITVITKENAKKRNYTETLIVDLSGSNATEADEIARFLGGKVSTLPAGEISPAGADLLVIIGASQE